MNIRWDRVALLAAILIAIIIVGTLTGFVVGAVRGLPDIDVTSQNILNETSFIYDRHGERITPVPTPENRIPVEDIDQIPEHVRNAFIAVEDVRFENHFGVDPIGILRAAWNNLTTDTVQGGSTITQQLARNTFPQTIGSEQTYQRKIQEAIVAIQMEQYYTKNEILLQYLNTIYLGQNAWGLQAASQTYFGKDVTQLTLAEGAILAGLPKAPSRLNPLQNTNEQTAVNPAALERQRLVLNRMVDAGFISETEAAQAASQEITLNPNPQFAQERDIPYPHFVNYVWDQAQAIMEAHYRNQGFGESEAQALADQIVWGGGLDIYTTLDPEIQTQTKQTVRQIMDERYPAPEDPEVQAVEAAAVITDPHTGEIISLVGGREDPKLRGFNYAVHAPRQPGSAMKPLLAYGPALEMGYTAASVIDDMPKVYNAAKPYAPRNYDERYFGLTTFREALRRSVNVAAIRVFNDEVGIDNGIAFAGKLGLEEIASERQPSAVLGGLGRGVSVLDMTEAYGVFANGGIHIKPYAIREIRDRSGDTVYRAQPKREPVISEGISYVMTDMLRSVVEGPRSGAILSSGTTGARANNGEVLSQWSVAGKTGTTSEQKDAWFMGYTPQYAGGVWIGYPEPQRIPGASGGGVPASIWNNMMTEAHRDLEIQTFTRPDAIVERRICTKSGLLAGENCPSRYQRNEIFVEGTEPTSLSEAFTEISVIEVTEEQLSQHPQMVEQYPSLQWNQNVRYDEGCLGLQPENKLLLNRPPVDLQALARYAQVRQRGGPLSYVPQDASIAVPNISCSDVEALFERPGSGIDMVMPPKEGSSAQYNMVFTSGGLFGGTQLRPRFLTVPMGQEVYLVISNQTEETHRWAIEAFNIEVELDPGQTVRVEIPTDESGVWSYEDPDHRSEQGRLVISESAGRDMGTIEDSNADETPDEPNNPDETNNESSEPDATGGIDEGNNEGDEGALAPSDILSPATTMMSENGRR